MAINWGSNNKNARVFDSIYGLTMHSISGKQVGGNRVFNNYGVLSYPDIIIISPDNNIFSQYISSPISYNIDPVVIAAGGVMAGLEENREQQQKASIVSNPAKTYAVLSLQSGTKGNFSYDISNRVR